MRENDTGDFQLHRADAHPLPKELQKQIGRFGSPRQDDPIGKDLNLPLELGIGADLAMGVVVPARKALYQGLDVATCASASSFSS